MGLLHSHPTSYLHGDPWICCLSPALYCSGLFLRCAITASIPSAPPARPSLPRVVLPKVMGCDELVIVTRKPSCSISSQAKACDWMCDCNMHNMHNCEHAQAMSDSKVWDSLLAQTRALLFGAAPLTEHPVQNDVPIVKLFMSKDRGLVRQGCWVAGETRQVGAGETQPRRFFRRLSHCPSCLHGGQDIRKPESLCCVLHGEMRSGANTCNVS